MKKVIIIGCPGAGKSTFARELQKATDLPLYYLDMLWHKPDKTTYSREVFDEKLLQIMAQEEWILDGNYTRTLEMRLKHCDTVFFLDFPTELCIEGARKRIGHKREDLPWVETELDEEFRQFILDFQKDKRTKIYDLLEQYKDRAKVVVFKSREELADAIAVIGI